MPLTLLKQRLGVSGLWWSGRRESNRMASLEDWAVIMVLTRKMLTCGYPAAGDVSDRC